jgi:hypothetical protein
MFGKRFLIKSILIAEVEIAEYNPQNSKILKPKIR